MNSTDACFLSSRRSSTRTDKFSMVRDRKEINVTVVEEESRSGFEDFSAADSFVSTCKGKSSIDEWNFPSRSVVVIFLRSLKEWQYSQRLHRLEL